MNKFNLVEKYQSKFGVSKTQAENAVEFLLEEIKSGVLLNGKVSLNGFGIFTKKEMKARVARNPRTGELVDVPAHCKVKFAVAKSFKEAVK